MNKVIELKGLRLCILAALCVSLALSCQTPAGSTGPTSGDRTDDVKILVGDHLQIDSIDGIKDSPSVLNRNKPSALFMQSGTHLFHIRYVSKRDFFNVKRISSA